MNPYMLPEWYTPEDRPLIKVDWNAGNLTEVLRICSEALYHLHGPDVTARYLQHATKGDHKQGLFISALYCELI